MADRIVTDSAGRTWTCVATDTGDASGSAQGRDVVLACTSPSVDESVSVTVGWQWRTMSPNGLARMITMASPVLRETT